jgi:peptide/nickel transport system substrate-binding protein
MIFRRLLLGVCVAITACAEPQSPAIAAGTMVISTPGDPDVLLPPLVSSVQGRQVTDLVFDRLAVLGDSLNTIGDHGFIPQLARSWSWSSDSLRISFNIDVRAKWHDGKPVTASDVRFTFNSYRDTVLASSTAPLLATIDSVSAPDSATAVFWFHSRSPEQFYDAAAQMGIIPEHVWKTLPTTTWRAADQSKHPIGSGRFRFVSWNPGVSINLVADSLNYRGRPKLDRVIWSIAPDFNTALARFLGGQTDLFEAIRPENLTEVAKHPELRVITLAGVDYSFLDFNLVDPKNPARPHPLFGERALRRALTMAVDRASVVRSVYDSLALPAIGPTIRAFPSTDPNLPQIPFDTSAAARTLDSLGWRAASGSATRSKGGRELAFSVLVPSSSKPRMRMAVLVQEQLRRIGVKMDIESVPFPTFVERTHKRDFDGLLNALHSDPSPSAAREDWTSAGIATGNNKGSYRNASFDAAVDSALATYDLTARRALFSRAYNIAIQDAPAIWLAEPRAAIGLHRRIRTAGLRPNAWWQHIAEWWIPPQEQIERDRMATPLVPVADSPRKTP